MQLWSVCLKENSDLSLMLLPAAEYALLHHTSSKLLWRKATKTWRLPVICEWGLLLLSRGDLKVPLWHPYAGLLSTGPREQQIYNKKKETWGVLPVWSPSMGKSNEIICILIYGGECWQAPPGTPGASAASYRAVAAVIFKLLLTRDTVPGGGSRK